jgi:hypothetical protein
MKKIALIVAMSLVSISCYASQPEVELCNALLREMLEGPEIVTVDTTLAKLKICMERHAEIRITFGKYCGSPFALEVAIKLNNVGFKFSQQLLQYCKDYRYLVIDTRNSLPQGSVKYNQLNTIVENGTQTVKFIEQIINEQTTVDSVQE